MDLEKEKINASEIMSRVRKRSGLYAVTVEQVLLALEEEILQELECGRSVALLSLGVLCPSFLPARTGSHPKRHERVTWPATRRIVFRMSKKLKARMNPDTPVLAE